MDEDETCGNKEMEDTSDTLGRMRGTVPKRMPKAGRHPTDERPQRSLPGPVRIIRAPVQQPL